MKKKERLDKLLLLRGLVQSREEGRGRILAGKVVVDDKTITKAGTLISENAHIRIRSELPYVSRGGSKLEKALHDFDVGVTGKIALDVGASTGGFTDCLLAHGARLVYAVDVGYGQLHWTLRNDPRVVVLERTNIRYLELAALAQPVDVATIDVSFISLRLVLPQVKKLLTAEGTVIALIKPQFEVGKGNVGKGGVVRSEEERLRAIEEIKQAAFALDYTGCDVIESPLMGPKGNKEFFIHLKKWATRPPAGFRVSNHIREEP